jgi:hypothetical protein
MIHGAARELDKLVNAIRNRSAPGVKGFRSTAVSPVGSTTEQATNKTISPMKMTSQKRFGADAIQSSPARKNAKPRELLSRVSCALKLKLVASGYGRIGLHLLAAVKTGHYLWHFQGIARELPAALIRAGLKNGR